MVHKYLSLHNKLREYCNVLTIIGEGEFGISKEQFDHFQSEHKTDVVLQTMSSALETLKEVDYKIGIFSSNGRKGFVNPDGTEPPPLGARHPGLGKDIAIAKQKGALPIQISEMITDFYYAGADIVSLVSPAMRKMHIDPSWLGTHHRYQWRPFNANPEPEYIYSNCLLWEDNEECLPYLSKADFCKKYNLDENEDIYLYLPSQCSSVIGGTAREAYIKACELKNVVVKLHPKEYFRLASGRHDNKWSYEICGIKAPILDPLDTHWAYKYANLAMSNQSSISIEASVYKLPFLYIHPPRFPWSNLFFKFANVCGLNDFDKFIENKEYKNKIENLDVLCDKILTDSKRKASDILSEQIRGLLSDIIR